MLLKKLTKLKNIMFALCNFTCCARNQQIFTKKKSMEMFCQHFLEKMTIQIWFCCFTS